MATGLYLDTSAVLRAVLETGTTPEVEILGGDATFASSGSASEFGPDCYLQTF